MTPSGSALGQLRRFINTCAASERSDGELLGGVVASSDPVAFEAIVRRHGPLVLGVCRRQLQLADEVEDCFQATFVIFLRKAASIRNGASLASWLYGTAVRVCKHARTRRWPIPTDTLEPVVSPGTDVETKDLARLLDDEVQRLPEQYRVPILLCHFEGHTQERAAELLGLPTGTVATRVSRGLKRVRERLERRGHSLPTIVPPALPAALIEKALQATPSIEVAQLAAAVLHEMALARLGRFAVVMFFLVGTAAGVGYLVYPKSSSVDPKPPLVARTNLAAQSPRWTERVRFQLDKVNFPVQVMEFDADGTRLALVAPGTEQGFLDRANSNLAIRLYDARTGRPHSTLVRDDDIASDVRGVAFHGGRLIASETGLYSWDLARKESKLLVPRLHQLGNLLGLEGNTVAVQTPTGVGLFDARSGQSLGLLPGEAHTGLGIDSDVPGPRVWEFTSLVFPPGRREIVTLDPRAVSVWDRNTSKRLRRFPLPNGFNWPADLSGDGRFVAHLHANDGTVRIWDLPSGQSVSLPQIGWQKYAVCFSPNGRSLAIAGEEIRLWDVTASRFLESPHEKPLRPFFRLAFALDGRTLAAGDLGGGVVVWSLP